MKFKTLLNKKEIIIILINIFLLFLFYHISNINYFGLSDGDDTNYLSAFMVQETVHYDYQHFKIVLIFNTIFFILSLISIIIFREKYKLIINFFTDIYLFIYLYNDFRDIPE